MILYILSPLLFVLSLVFGLVVKIKNLSFKLSWIKTSQLNKPVISVGNISVGGSGKTAVVLKILEQWPDLCVLTRGYKSKATKSKQVPVLVKDSDHPILYGDEPSLIKKKYPDAMIVIDPNRFNGAQFALRLNSKITGFILDDGFQHQQLSRNLNILLLDVEMYFKQPGLLPLGRFRENFKAIKRADHILLTKWDFQSQKAMDQLVAKIKKHNIDYDFLESKIARVENHKGINLKSKKIILMSGLGQPSVFEKDFMKSYPDVKIIQHYKYKDHYNYTSEDIENILNLTNTNNCELVCSEKDYIKIQALELGLDQIYYTIQELQIGERLTSKIQKLFKRD